MLTPEARAIVRDAFLEGRDEDALKILVEEDAEALLARLSAHFKDPVLPLHRFCRAMESWAAAISQNYARPEGDRGPGDRVEWRHGASYASLLGEITIDIRKSALLNRLLYRGEKLRTVECPTHRGHLYMAEWLGAADDPCEHGCGGTGWLPTP